MKGVPSVDLSKTRRTIQALSNGINPMTWQRIAPGTPLEHPDVIQALKDAIAALDAQIKGHQRKQDFRPRRGTSRAPDQRQLKLLLTDKSNAAGSNGSG